MQDFPQEPQQQADMIAYVDEAGELMTPEELEAKRKAKLDGLYAMFVEKRDRWVQHRAQCGVEANWKKAMALYAGEAEQDSVGTLEDTLKNGPTVRSAQNTQPRSRVVVNIVRPKVEQAIAKICEILLPTDDRNWGLKPTPMPDINKLVGNNTPTVDPATGQPTGNTANQEAQMIIAQAKERAEAMQRQIDDRLTECNYNGEQRMMIRDGVLLGTGIIKGPFPVRKESKRWDTDEQSGVSTLSVDVQITGASARKDPWDIYFDPACGNDHQRGAGVMEKRLATRKELRALIGVPGYDAEAIKEVLRQKPMRVSVANGRIDKKNEDDDAYELWEYHGEVEPEDIEQLTGCYQDEPLQDVDFGVVVIVNDKIIGALDSWVTDKRVPYDVWCWRKSDDSPFGECMPLELDHQQRVVNAAWRQVMDNARAAVGGQIVIKKGQIVPQDGKWSLSPMKVWLAKDDLDDVRTAFSTFEFNSHLQELLTIATTAMQFADQETSMPQMLGGEKGTAPETVGGMSMLFGAATSVLRQRVKLYDDAITRPHISRYYDWEMLTNQNPAIKGDFEVDARGSTSLFEKDIQNQGMMQLAGIVQSPMYAPLIKPKESLEAILKAWKIDPDSIIKSDEELKKEAEAAQQQQQPADPRIEAEQIRAQTKQLEIEDRKEARAVELQLAQEENAVKQQSIAYNIERERAEAEQSARDAELTREITIAKMLQDGQLTREEAEAKYRLETLKLSSDREMFNAEMAVKINQGSGI